MSIRVLFLGEIVGKPGITTVKSALRQLREDKQIDLVVANAEGATGGFGLGKAHAMQLSKLGIDIITGGEKIYYKKDMVEFIGKNPNILRPANYPPQNPGRGIRYLEIKGMHVCVINLLGNANFPRTHLGNSFSLAQILVDKAKENNQVILVQYHASTTAEKSTMGFMLDGKVSAVIGTHSKVMGADARILAGGTAFVSDNGRCGSQTSVGGFLPKTEINKFLTQIPVRSDECWDGLQLQGVLVEIGEDGKAIAIETVKKDVEQQKTTEAAHV
jgi:metallophosphoesterase (TIGR00282 family)